MKDQIEHMDTNLIRFNVKKESDLFVSKIQAFNKDEPTHTIVKITEPTGTKIKPSVKKEFSCCLKVISENKINNLSLQNLNRKL